MINVDNFFKFLKNNKVNFYTGVPDSILKKTKRHFENLNFNNHIPVNNEGSAVAAAIGYYLTTKKIACVYMQNSGLGNAINPLISIAHSKVYSIPMMLLIGWRGSPGIKDEPQHKVKGSITIRLLKLLNIKYCVLNTEKDLKKLKKLLTMSKKNNCAVACLVKKETFCSDNFVVRDKIYNKILREDFIKALLRNVKNKTKIVSTTGYASRELNQVRKKYNFAKGKDFYMVGGMGHSSMVSLVSSLFTKNNVICLDGDGSILMHMGSLASIGTFGRKNIKHIILNNYGHESVGGQKTFSENINFRLVSKGMGYKKYFFLDKNKKMENVIKQFLRSKGPSLLEVIILQKSMKNLERPKNFYEIKKKFMVS